MDNGTQNHTFIFHTDPGHAWLEVDIAELKALGIAEQISAYSYLSNDGKTAFLEEDCDACKFITAYETKHECKMGFNDCYEEYSSIRNLGRFYPSAIN